MDIKLATLKYKYFQKLAPTMADYRVPTNQVEHNLIVSNLMAGGSLQSEAELVFTARKNAFNKAMREYKKETGIKQQQGRKSTRNSKHVGSQQSQNGL